MRGVTQPIRMRGYMKKNKRMGEGQAALSSYCHQSSQKQKMNDKQKGGGHGCTSMWLLYHSLLLDHIRDYTLDPTNTFHPVSTFHSRGKDVAIFFKHFGILCSSIHSSINFLLNFMAREHPLKGVLSTRETHFHIWKSKWKGSYNTVESFKWVTFQRWVYY